MADNPRGETFKASEPATSTSTPWSEAVFSRLRQLLKQYGLVTALVVAPIVLLVWGAWLLYHTNGDRTFGRSLADILLQVALVVLVGTVLNEVIKRNHRTRDKKEEDLIKARDKKEEDLIKARDKKEEDRIKQINRARDEEQHRRNKQMELMRRMREAHVRIANAQQLIYACPSRDTYSEQMRVLMRVIPDLEDIQQDVAATTDVFCKKLTDREDIQKGISDIVKYLYKGYYEYTEWSRKEVKRTWSRQFDMEWIAKLGDSRDGMPKEYVDALNKSKGKIRSYVYGAGIDEVEPEASTATIAHK